jgi:hypothetical protein
MDAAINVRADGCLDVVAFAELFDTQLDTDPCVESEPELFGLLDAGSEYELAHWPEIDHHTLMWRVVPPPNCLALILTTTGWSAPMTEDPDDQIRPSLHPDRQRVSTVTVIANDDEIVTVMRVENGEPMLLTGDCEGRAPDALRACWSRRFSAD